MKLKKLGFVMSVLLVAIVIVSCDRPAAVGEQKAKEKEDAAKQQINRVKTKTDEAQQSIQQSEQRVKDAEKKLNSSSTNPSNSQR
jgi:uncharacterized protein YlxW (UPF0749 family)